MNWKMTKMCFILMMITCCSITSAEIVDGVEMTEKNIAMKVFGSVSIQTAESVMVELEIIQKNTTSKHMYSDVYDYSGVKIDVPKRSNVWIDGLSEEEYRLKVISWESGGYYGIWKQSSQFCGAYSLSWDLYGYKYASSRTEYLRSPEIQDRAAWDYVQGKYRSWKEAFRHISSKGWY